MQVCHHLQTTCSVSPRKIANQLPYISVCTYICLLKVETVGRETLIDKCITHIAYSGRYFRIKTWTAREGSFPLTDNC